MFHTVCEEYTRGLVKRWLQEPPEGNTAAELGLTASTPDGTILMMQLPPLLPSVTLVEAAERLEAGAAAHNSGKPHTRRSGHHHLSGPDVLRALPHGKVCLHFVSSRQQSPIRALPEVSQAAIWAATFDVSLRHRACHQ